ncbi:MAG: phytochelatin synthase family protein [Gallionella sp.]
MHISIRRATSRSRSGPGEVKRILFIGFVLSLLSSQLAVAESSPTVIYWDSPAGRVIRARMPADADYWQLIPNFSVQMTQSYCSVASAITVLNSMPIKKPVDPTYAPYAYFTQSNFFTPEVSGVIGAETVLKMGMTRDEMVGTLRRQGVEATSIAGDSISTDELRSLLKKALVDDGQFVLANYLRATLDQVGGGHWSALAAYDEATDRVLILDVAKYKYAPAWVEVATLKNAINTLDTTSNRTRGLVIVSTK